MHSFTAPEVCKYLEVRYWLSTDNSLVFLNQRTVIPTAQCAKVLHNLHPEHQGEVGMMAYANESVYWPEMKTSIRTAKANCTVCSKIPPSQPTKPITLTPSPDWPSSIFSWISYVGNHGHLACTDRLTSWLILYHLSHRQANTSKIILICQDIYYKPIAPLRN